MSGTTILSDFLTLLEVPHTGAYTDSQFMQMPFKSLFGFSRLLNAYGVNTEGLVLSDKSMLSRIPTPFIAQSGSGFVIVKNFTHDDGGKPEVEYLYYHQSRRQPLDDFLKKASGVVLLAYPDENSREKDYATHRRFEIIGNAKNILLAVCTLVLLVAGAVYTGLFSRVSTALLALLTLAGVAVTFMLIQKSARIKNHTADKMCGIIQKHGCDTVLEQKASTFFGIFSWSEVGIAYFGVTLAVMMLFPDSIPELALVNGCCCPFSFWSVWYQKFRIKTWCTLCLTVQAILWLQLACYISGGWWEHIFPLSSSFVISFIILCAAYFGVLLAVNKLMAAFSAHHPEK